jgi:hypothetical protein
MKRPTAIGLIGALVVAAMLATPVSGATPVVVDHTAVTSEDTPVVIDRTGDTYDATGAVAEITDAPLHGGAVFDGDVLTYTPGPGYVGTDEFRYKVIDEDDGESGTATVSVSIEAINDPDAINAIPVAGDDSASVSEDGSVDIDVLGNDSDADLDPLTMTALSLGSHGNASIVGTKIRYVPAPNYSGPDSFTYRASDGNGGTSDVATVSVTVTPTNDAPVATADSRSVAEDGSVDINVVANDGDADGDTLSASNVSDPPNGTASASGGTVHYVPDPDYSGPDSFSYTADDGSTTSNAATVSVTVTPVNDPPVADDDEFTVPEDAAATPLLVLAGDTDVDDVTLTITAKTNGAHGMVAITGGGTGLTYRPNPNYSGDDAFTYTISDGQLTDTASVTVHVGGENDPPIAAPDAFHVAEGAGAVSLDILSNDSDPDGNPLIVFSRTAALHGTVTITGNGTGLTYDPSGIYHGSDKFKYTITDGNGGFTTATVLVTVDLDTTDPVVRAPVERFIGQTAGTSTTKVRLGWSATDAGSGVASYKLQVSTDGGSYKTVTLSKSTSTSVDRTLTTGHSYRFRVRSTDKEGNVSSYSYGPTLTVKRYSQESSLMVYVGSWKKTTPSKALGGSARYATTSTRSATFRFTGYDVGWIATRYRSSGKAQVLIDGVVVTTLDLDTSSTAYRKLVFQRHFSTLGAHTLQIRPVGDGRVDIDGFVVLK